MDSAYQHNLQKLACSEYWWINN